MRYTLDELQRLAGGMLEKRGKNGDDIKFVGVRFSHCLEPDSRACCFEAYQAERSARVELLEVSRESNLQWFNLPRNPRAHLGQPSWFGKCTFIASLSAVGESPKGVANPTEILRIPKGINDQRGDGDPECG